MLKDRLEKLNALRKQAMKSDRFLRSAQEHEKAIKESTPQPKPVKRRKRNKSQTKLSQQYRGVDFATQPYAT
ncbi:hypothetical protein [Vibrio panuliri]|uniref:Uncharacterized protein n=1 Tax=Vibrio panuliri TaxID=1381081 RepID=A0A1Q9HRH6_9VIBR|nr:hypothetical protein [Vibrio panuliri]KAB1458313.1 hypothetical protein F7O85_11470 [Vibrio panuliri]OLQ86777.1 hypothetical protein BIY20_02475 [Vibrio panuliri]OLQ93435.1 hypothetical protein BIY22_02800 [Vibrio panuliri]